MNQAVEYQLDHITLRGLSWGTPDKPLVLALHGWLDNAASFIPLAEFLPDYHLVAIDLAGHGLSEHRSTGAHYHQMDFVYDLHNLILSQKWQQVTLLGHSMGGIISSLYAGTFPERVRRLISIEAMGAYTKDPATSTEQLRSAIESRITVAGSQVRHPQSVEMAVRARLAAGDVTPSAARLLVERNLRSAADGQLNWRTDRRLRTVSPLRLVESQAKAFMQGISCPMQVITGEQGFAKVANAVSDRADWVENLVHQSVPGGHHVHMENPKPVADAVNSFIQGTELP